MTVSKVSDEGMLRSNEQDPFYGCWQVGDTLGTGGFGEVRVAIDNVGREYVAKLERKHPKETLPFEYEMYRKLLCHERHIPGLPRIFKYGINGTSNVLIMNRLGASLMDISRHNAGRSFPAYTVLKIGRKALKILEYVHNKGIVHGDIKPHNFLSGQRTMNEIYLVDFGLAQFWHPRRPWSHVEFSTGNKFHGTKEFASRNAHRGYRLSRRDDLESLGYAMIYMWKGSLPWYKEGENISLRETERLKEFASPESIYGETDAVMEEFFSYVRNLRFAQKPDYHYLRTLFKNRMERLTDAGEAHNANDFNIWVDGKEHRLQTWKLKMRKCRALEDLADREEIAPLQALFWKWFMWCEKPLAQLEEERSCLSRLRWFICPQRFAPIDPDHFSRMSSERGHPVIGEEGASQQFVRRNGYWKWLPKILSFIYNFSNVPSAGPPHIDLVFEEDFYEECNEFDEIYGYN